MTSAAAPVYFRKHPAIEMTLTKEQREFEESVMRAVKARGNFEKHGKWLLSLLGTIIGGAITATLMWSSVQHDVQSLKKDSSDHSKEPWHGKMAEVVAINKRDLAESIRLQSEKTSRDHSTLKDRTLVLEIGRKTDMDRMLREIDLIKKGLDKLLARKGLDPSAAAMARRPIAGSEFIPGFQVGTRNTIPVPERERPLNLLLEEHLRRYSK